ncbi:MAG: hypothetical protein LIP02_03705 [Bacteroidales bacterium]|nr:hypothetical protein [Bacteroidales bacterium]
MKKSLIILGLAALTLSACNPKANADTATVDTATADSITVAEASADMEAPNTVTETAIQGSWQSLVEPCEDQRIVVEVDDNDISVRIITAYEVSANFSGTAVFAPVDAGNRGMMLNADCNMTDLYTNEYQRMSMRFQPQGEGVMDIEFTSTHDSAAKAGLGTNFKRITALKVGEAFTYPARHTDPENPTVVDMLADSYAFTFDQDAFTLLGQFYPGCREVDNSLQYGSNDDRNFISFWDSENYRGFSARLYKAPNKGGRAVLVTSLCETPGVDPGRPLNFYVLNSNPARITVVYAPDILPEAAQAEGIEYELDHPGQNALMYCPGQDPSPENRRVLHWNGNRFTE